MRGTNKSTSYIRLDVRAEAEPGQLPLLLTWLSEGLETKTEKKKQGHDELRLSWDVFAPLAEMYVHCQPTTGPHTHPTRSVGEAAVAVRRLLPNGKQ